MEKGSGPRWGAGLAWQQLRPGLISEFKNTTLFPAGRHFYFPNMSTIFSLGFSAPWEEDREDGNNPTWAQEDGGGVPQVTGIGSGGLLLGGQGFPRWPVLQSAIPLS